MRARGLLLPLVVAVGAAVELGLGLGKGAPARRVLDRLPAHLVGSLARRVELGRELPSHLRLAHPPPRRVEEPHLVLVRTVRAEACLEALGQQPP